MMTTIAQLIAGRNTARLDIPVIGDSVTEGQGATLLSDRWIQQANGVIRAAYPGAGAGTGGGLGFIPIGSTGQSSFTWPVTLASGSPGNISQGPVRDCQYFTSAGSWTWTAPAGTTSVRVMYCDIASFPGTWSYQVGSGAAVDVTTSAGAGDGQLTASIPISGGQVLTVAWVSGYALIDGIVHCAGDENSGITFHGCGHFGWSTTSWEQSAYSPWIPSIAALVPHAAALGVFLGLNDASTASGDLTAAQFQASLESLIGSIQAYGAPLSTAPLIGIIPYEAEETFADTGGWPAYVTAWQAVTASYPGSVTVNLAALMQPVASDPGYYADSVHPNNAGHALIGGYVADALITAAPELSSLLLLTTGL